MFKTFAAVLIAASMLTAPALAQGTVSAKATEMTKVVSHKHARVIKHGRHHVKHVRHVRHGRHHVRHTGKHTHAVHVVRHASKIRAN